MKSIFKYFMEETKNTLSYEMWFTDTFSINDFVGVEKMVYLYIEYCARLGIQAKREYLEAFLKTDGKTLIFENNIKLDNMGQLDYNDPSSLEQAYRLVASALLTYYDESSKIELIDRSFKVDIDSWMTKQKKANASKTITDNFPRLQGGDNVDDVIADIQARLQDIADTYSKEQLDYIDFLDTTDMGVSDSEAGAVIGKTHISCIDADKNGILERDCITFTGLTGSGKTRALARVAYNLAVLEGKDVRFDTLELSKGELKNILVSIHICTLFNGKVKIPDSVKNDGTITKEENQYFEAAKEDLFNNPRYGKLFIYDKPIEADNFYKNAVAWRRLHKDCKVWFIDYAGLATVSQNYRGSRYTADIIELLYSSIRRVKNFTKTGFAVINQYNKEGAEKARAGKRIDQGDIQGGQTVHKYTTYNVYSTQTIEQKAANLQVWSCDKARFAKGFNNVPMKTDLSISKFVQQKKAVAS